MSTTSFRLLPEECTFCKKVETWKLQIPNDQPVYNFQPLNPVTEGHRLFVPVWHVEDYTQHPGTAAIVNQAVAEYAAWYEGPSNVISSAGVDATQSVFHYHVHFIPRRPGDGLHLPWTGQFEREGRA